MLQLGVIGRRDLVHRRQQGINDFQIDLQLVLPRRQVHIGEADLDLAAYFFRLVAVPNGGQVVVVRVEVFQLVGQVINAGDVAGLIERADLGQRIRVVRTQGLERQAEGLNRAF